MIRFDWMQVTAYDDLPPSVLFDRIAADLPGAHRIEHGGKGRFGVSPYRRRGGQVSVLGRRLPLGLVPPDVTADRFGRRSVGGSLR